MMSRHHKTRQATAAPDAAEPVIAPVSAPASEPANAPANAPASASAPAADAPIAPATDADAALAASRDADAHAMPVAEAAAAVIAAALETQLAEQKDKYLRLAAEYDNFRKRATRDRQKAELEGMGLLIRGVLDALDDLGRFAHVEPGSTDARTLQQGVELVEKKLLKSLAGHGLEVVNPAGQPFDPAVHEAVMTAPATSEDEDHLVSQVFQVGYLFNGQLLRPARVVVAQWSGASERAPERVNDDASRASASTDS